MKKQIYTFMLFIFFYNNFSLAMGRRIPEPQPKPPVEAEPPVSLPVIAEPPALKNPTSPIGFDVFHEVAYPVGLAVDQVYKSNKELLISRNISKSHRVDFCDINLEQKDTFADRIAYAVELKMQPSIAQLTYVASYFNLPKSSQQYVENSLISHPLCLVTPSSLQKTLRGKNMPSKSTIVKANRFATEMNQYRREIIQGQMDSYQKASQLWSKFFMCLSYMESLTTADTDRSQRVAQKYAPKNYRRPAGVNFYEDPNQPLVSRLNIGLFQFTPDAGGNIQSCIREWNQIYPRCSVSQNATQSELIQILGSSLQTFNAFCAASKVTGMFSVQINTVSAKNTHPNNFVQNRLLPSDLRCVSPHMDVSLSYNHFAPLQNSSGFTLGTILNCVYPN